MTANPRLGAISIAETAPSPIPMLLGTKLELDFLEETLRLVPVVMVVVGTYHIQP